MANRKTIFRQIDQLFAMSRSESEVYDSYRYICMQFAEYLAKKRNTTKFLICKIKAEEVNDYLQKSSMSDNPEMNHIYWCALKILEKITCKYFWFVDWELPEEKIKPRCPYCGSNTKLVDSKLIYGKSYGMAYVCENYPTCDAYVGTHKGTIWPRGTLANKELRNYRKKAHMLFDSLWRSEGISRTKAYKWLAEKLDISFEKTHIGYFDLEMCLKVIDICKEKKFDFCN